MGFRDCLRTPVIRSVLCMQGYRRSDLCDGVLNHLLVRHIGFVADQQLVDTFGCIAVNLLQPLLDVFERIHVGDIVDDADAMGATIVRRGDGTEAFLASSIPLL